MSQAPAILHPTPPSLRDVLSHAHFNRQEIAGALGDLGTFLPLLVGIVCYWLLRLAAKGTA